MDKLFMPVHGAKELKRLTDAELFDELKSIKSWIQYFPNTVMGPPVVMGKHAVQCIRGPYLTYCTRTSHCFVFSDIASLTGDLL